MLSGMALQLGVQNFNKHAGSSVGYRCVIVIARETGLNQRVIGWSLQDCVDFGKMG